MRHPVTPLITCQLRDMSSAGGLPARLKCSASCICPSARIDIAKHLSRATIPPRAEFLLRQTRIKSGSSDSEVMELTVAPCHCAPRPAVMIATPVGKRLITCRKSWLDNDGEAWAGASEVFAVPMRSISAVLATDTADDSLRASRSVGPEHVVQPILTHDQILSLTLEQPWRPSAAQPRCLSATLR
jgi:hypothetical protein